MKSFHYTSKVWLVTVLIAPVLLMVYISITNAPTSDDFTSLPLLLGAITVYGIVLSIPSFLLSWWMVTGVKKMFPKVWVQKVVISAAGVVFIILTQLIVDYRSFVPLTLDSVLYPGVYFVVLTGAVFFFSIEK